MTAIEQLDAMIEKIESIISHLKDDVKLLEKKLGKDSKEYLEACSLLYLASCQLAATKARQEEIKKNEMQLTANREHFASVMAKEVIARAMMK